MAITYPLSIPTTQGFESISFTPMSVVGMSQSTFTGQQQVYAYAGQWWEVEFTIAPMARAKAAAWAGFFAALNGVQGTFYLGDSLGRVPTGTIAGTVTVGSGATAGSTTLPLSGGTGSFGVGDWLQVSTNLYCVTQVNAGSVDVFPKLRSSYSSGTAITYNSAKGVFRLKAPVPFKAGKDRIYQGITVSAIEAI